MPILIRQSNRGGGIVKSDLYLFEREQEKEEVCVVCQQRQEERENLVAADDLQSVTLVKLKASIVVSVERTKIFGRVTRCQSDSVGGIGRRQSFQVLFFSDYYLLFGFCLHMIEHPQH